MCRLLALDTLTAASLIHSWYNDNTANIILSSHIQRHSSSRCRIDVGHQESASFWRILDQSRGSVEAQPGVDWSDEAGDDWIFSELVLQMGPQNDLRCLEKCWNQMLCWRIRHGFVWGKGFYQCPLSMGPQSRALLWRSVWRGLPALVFWSSSLIFLILCHLYFCIHCPCVPRRRACWWLRDDDMSPDVTCHCHAHIRHCHPETVNPQQPGTHDCSQDLLYAQATFVMQTALFASIYDLCTLLL